MALSLDDLKKKRPTRGSSPVGNGSPLNNSNGVVPQRKKLSPWESFSTASQTPETVNPTIPPESKSGNLDEITEVSSPPLAQSTESISEKELSVSQEPSKIETTFEIIADASTTTVGGKTISTSTFSEAGNTSEAFPLIVEEPVAAKSDLTPKIEVAEPFDLNASECPVLSEANTPCSDIHFSEIENPEKLLQKAATQKIEYQHSTDTVPTQNNRVSSESTDTKLIQSNVFRNQSTDTVPTHNIESLDHNATRSTDTVPTQNNVVNDCISNVTFNNTDTVPTQFKELSAETKLSRTDTIPTHYAPKRIKSANNQEAGRNTKPSHSTDTVPTHLLESSENQKKEPTQSRHSTDTIPTQVPTHFFKPTEDSTDTNILSINDIELRIQSLKLNPKLVFDYISKSCLINKTNFIQITYLQLADQTGVNKGSIVTTTKRLRNMGFITVTPLGKGPGTPLLLTLQDLVLKVVARQTLLNFSVNQKVPTQILNLSKQSTDTNTDTNAPSKLVSNINTNLLTSENRGVPPEVASQSPSIEVHEINIDQLTKFHISRKQIQDIKNQKLNFTTSTLQDFVDRFGIYASDSKNIRNVNSVPAVFVKMAQLASKGEDPLIDIETDTDRLIREHLERLKAKSDERSKQLSELVELEFENWLEEIKMEGRDKFAPPSQMMKSGSFAQKMTLKQYFTETIWPEKARQFGITSSMEANI